MAAWVWQGCHTLLICVHLCLSVGGFLCQKVLCVPRVLWDHSLCLLCWCCRGSCTSVVVFSHGIHGIHRMLGCVIGGVGMAGMPYPPNLCASVSICGRLSLPEGSVCSAYSVGHSLCLLCWCICGRHISAGFRPLPNQIPSATQSDCVRHPIRFRPLHDAISRAFTLHRFHFNIQYVPLLHPFMFAKLRNKFDF